MSPERLLDRLTQELQLSPGQRGEIGDLLQDYQQKMRQAIEERRKLMEQNREKFRQLREQLRQAQTPEERRKLFEQMRELMGGPSTIGQLREELLDAVEAYLKQRGTPEQQKRFQRLRNELFGFRGPGGPVSLETNPFLLMRALRDLEPPLTEEQRAQVREAFQAVRDALRDRDPQARQDAARALYKKLTEPGGILTPEQVRALKQWQPGRRAPGRFGRPGRGPQPGPEGRGPGPRRFRGPGRPGGPPPAPQPR